MLKSICLGGELFVPEDRIISVFPYSTAVGRKTVAAFRKNGENDARVYDCSGHRAKSSVVVVDGGESGTYLVLSPLSAKTIVRKRMGTDQMS